MSNRRTCSYCFRIINIKNNNYKPSVDHSLQDAQINITPGEALTAIKSFPNDTAPGLDYLRPLFIIDLLGLDSSEFLLNSLTKIFNLIINGKLPHKLAPIIFGARIIALEKAENQVRPIAIGIFYRRTIPKIICNRLKSTITLSLAPYQVGFGVKGGCEAAIHCSRLVLSNLKPEDYIVKLDISNAFNSINRNKMIDTFLETFPDYHNYIHLSYGIPSLLKFNDYIINSAEGLQQGDPLGPLLYFYILKHLISDIAFSCKLNLHVWYLDDCTISGTISSIQNCLDIINKHFDELNLSLNMNKCEIYPSPPPTDTILDNFRPTPLQDFSILRAPLGGAEGVFNFLNNHLQSLFPKLSILKKLPIHQAYYILKNALLLPQIQYCLKTSGAFSFEILLKEYEQKILQIMSELLNIKLDSKSWLQATLLCKSGGLGLRSALSIALVSFISSTLSLKNIASQIITIDKDNLLDEALRCWNINVLPNTAPPDSNKQKDWDQGLVSRSLAYLNLSDDHQYKSLLRSLNFNNSGHEWLDSYPSILNNQLIDNDAFRYAINLRLGVTFLNHYICNKCNQSADAYERHALPCKFISKVSRHDKINAIIASFLNKTIFPCILEPTSFSDKKRPDSKTVVPFFMKAFNVEFYLH
ncbi:uncharacterized protein LOC135922608 [Gordionus sp. m RMFG-2023]|uniref:uncharacterized protein LOC135922608 n=1 Tax=Gordionus sp. m RMFG-2023 TaxID=3053472 RepID=UPI0031FD18E2